MILRYAILAVLELGLWKRVPFWANHAQTEWKCVSKYRRRTMNVLIPKRVHLCLPTDFCLPRSAAATCSDFGNVTSSFLGRSLFDVLTLMTPAKSRPASPSRSHLLTNPPILFQPELERLNQIFSQLFLSSLLRATPKLFPFIVDKCNTQSSFPS